MTDALPELWILRHGETEWNREGRWQGRLDSPLTERGEAQARALGAMLRRLRVGPPRHLLLVSPQGRAMRTAELAFGPGAARPEPGLREIDVGEWSGRLMEDIRADPRTRPEADLRALYDAPPGGEGLLALERRCRALLDTLDRPTVLVGHGMTGRMLRTLALGCGPEALDDLPSGQGAAFRISHGREEAFWPEPEDASPPPA